MVSQRLELRRKRRSLTARQQSCAAISVSKALSTDLSLLKATRIAFYQARDGEISPQPFLEKCRKRGCRIYLPVIDPPGPGNDRGMVFQEFLPGRTTLVANRFGIAEPVPDPRAQIRPFMLDAILLPVVGFDRNGNRLGMGKGYYDRALAGMHRRFHRPRLIGLAHSVQETRITPSPWDARLDCIYTEREKISFHQGCVAGSAP